MLAARSSVQSIASKVRSPTPRPWIDGDESPGRSGPEDVRWVEVAVEQSGCTAAGQLAGFPVPVGQDLRSYQWAYP